MNKIVKSTLLAGFGIAAGATFASNASADTTYTVQSGDTLNQISKEFGVSVSDIATKNNINDVNFIYTGDNLVISSGSYQATETYTAKPAEQVQVTAPVVQEQTTSTNITSSDVSDALQALINRESSGNVNATNGQYYGIGQLSPQARATYGGNSTDYNDQLNAMKSYISERYGSAENAWAHSNAYGWY